MRVYWFIYRKDTKPLCISVSLSLSPSNANVIEHLEVVFSPFLRCQNEAKTCATNAKSGKQQYFDE